MFTPGQVAAYATAFPRAVGVGGRLGTWGVVGRAYRAGTLAAFSPFKEVFANWVFAAATDTTLTHTSPSVTVTVSGATVAGDITLAHTSPSVVGTVASALTSVTTLAHTSPSIVGTVAGATAVGALALAHTSPSVVGTVAGTTAPVDYPAVAHASPSVTATVASTITNVTTLAHTSPSAVVTVAGPTTVGALTVTHTSPSVAVMVAAAVAQTLAVAHTSPSVTATVAGATSQDSSTNIAHTSPSVAVTVASAVTNTTALAHTSPSVVVTLTGTTGNSIVDTFPGPGFDAVWTVYGSPAATISGGRARVPITTAASYRGIISATGYSLIGREFLAEVVRDVDPDPTVNLPEAYLWFGPDVGSPVAFDLIGNTLQFTGATTTSIAYDATAHRWWRLRELGGTVYWDTSPDAVTWTNRRTAATSGYTLTSGSLDLGGRRVAGSSDWVYFDNVNAPGAANVTTLAHTSPSVAVTSAGATAVGALAVTHTSPSVVATVVAGVTQTLALAHTSPSIVATVAGATTLGTDTVITHTSPTVTATVTGATVVGALTVTHTSPSVVGSVVSAVLNSTALTHTSPSVVATVAGSTVAGTTALLHASPTVTAVVTAGVTNTLTLAHTTPTATVTAGGQQDGQNNGLPLLFMWTSTLNIVNTLTVTHTSPTVVTTIAAGLTNFLGPFTVVAGKITRNYKSGELISR